MDSLWFLMIIGTTLTTVELDDRRYEPGQDFIRSYIGADDTREGCEAAGRQISMYLQGLAGEQAVVTYTCEKHPESLADELGFTINDHSL